MLRRKDESFPFGFKMTKSSCWGHKLNVYKTQSPNKPYFGIFSDLINQYNSI